jgi:tRNA pseudouridine55 synthase
MGMVNGILLVDKPILWTSHDVVDFVRRSVGQRRVGHAGTLDPMATGLLVLLLGDATKRSGECSGLDKDYRGSMCLGIETDTWDLEGRILSEKSPELVDVKEVEKIFSGLHGAQSIVPPSYSALRKNGKRFYELARLGVMLEPPPRDITVSVFRLEDFVMPEVYFFLSCSKGTYVRSLCKIVGEKLGCGAVLSSLVRTRIGPWHLSEALKVPALESVKSIDWQRYLLTS